MRRVPGGGAVAQGGGLVLVGHLHRRVGGRLEEETERPPGRYGYPGVERLDRLDDRPVRTVGRGLRLEPRLVAGEPQVHDEFGVFRRPIPRHLSAHVEPDRVPGLPPRPADGDRPESMSSSATRRVGEDGLSKAGYKWTADQK